jgi:hypothetical protein
MNRITILFLSLFVLTFGQNINKKISKTYSADKESKINIEGEIDVIVENWPKNEISINATLDIDLKDVFSFNSSGKHDIIIRKDGSNIFVIRKKPSTNFSVGSFVRDRSKVVINMPEWVDLEANIDDASFLAEKLSGYVTIKGADGSIVINNLTSKKAKIQFDDGSFKCNVLSGLVVITYSDGSVKIGESECDKLIAHFDDGSFAAKLNEKSRKTYIEFNDGSAILTLLPQENFSISAEYGDGRVRNRTDLKYTTKEESKIEIGEKNAPNEIQTWFDDGSLTIQAMDY